MATSGDVSLRQRPETPPNRTTAPKPVLSPRAPVQPDANIAIQSFKSGRHSLDIFSPVNQNGSYEFDRVIKSGKIHRRIKKKGAWKPSWKPAQLVLRPNCLSLYKDDDATELWASINLSDVTAVTPVRKTNTKHVFGVFCPSKNYHFQGQSEQDTADWVARIGKAAPIDMEEQLFLHNPENKSGRQNERSLAYETSDFDHSDAYEDRASSPEPTYGSIRARSQRSRANTAHRIPSQIHEYSGNEMMTSYSDFSDSAPPAGSSSLPRGVLGTSPPVQTQASYPSNAATTISPMSHPTTLRNLSQPSINEATSINNPYPSNTIHSDPSRVIRQGYLLILRRSSGVKSWKKLWVVLRPVSLSFYKTDAEYALVKLVQMAAVINAAEIDPISRSKNFCFQIISEDKTYRFACAGEEDLDAWLGALKSVLVRNKRERASSRAAEEAIQRGEAAIGQVERSIGELAVV